MVSQYWTGAELGWAACDPGSGCGRRVLRKGMANKKGGTLVDRAALQEAALQHLARYGATEAGLVQVLDRRILRWLRESGEPPENASAAREAARAVARELVGQGVIDDAAFAAARSRRLMRAGRSRRAVAAHLAAKGIEAEVAVEALPEDDYPAALVFVRRRRFGPFRTGPADPPTRQRELGAMARAGFGRDVSERALRTDPEEAERLLFALKQG